jgi:hypothetical protein
MKIERNFALDFVKGSCVIGMIIHHTLDYFPVSVLLHKYVRFITGSFVFVTGFLVTSIYLAKYDIVKERNKISFRLVSRGLKILFLFSALNIAIELIIDQNIDFRAFELSGILSKFYTVYFFGSYKIVAFELLIPISYTLILTGIMVFTLKEKIYLVLPLSITLFLYCSYFFFYQNAAYNLRYLTIGLLGTAFGLIPFKKIDKLRKHWYIVSGIFIVHLIILIYTRLYYPIYVLNVVFSLMFLYMLGSKIISNNIFIYNIILLGKYSLFAYLLQIAVLQIIARILPFRYLITTRAIAGFIVTLASVMLSVYLLNHYKKKSNFLSKLYNLVFS